MPNDPKPTLDEKTLEEWYLSTGLETKNSRALIDALRATQQEVKEWQDKHLKSLGSATRMTANMVTESSGDKKRIAELERQLTKVSYDWQQDKRRDRERIAELEKLLIEADSECLGGYFNQRWHGEWQKKVRAALVKGAK